MLAWGPSGDRIARYTGPDLTIRIGVKDRIAKLLLSHHVLAFWGPFRAWLHALKSSKNTTGSQNNFWDTTLPVANYDLWSCRLSRDRRRLSVSRPILLVFFSKATTAVEGNHLQGLQVRWRQGKNIFQDSKCWRRKVERAFGSTRCDCHCEETGETARFAAAFRMRLEAQQRYFSHRTMLVAIVSQNSFVLVFMGYRRDAPVWTSCQGGVAPFWGVLSSLWKHRAI